MPSARILAVCGPGNNGGDGLVAARHLKYFGHPTTILYPKATTNQLFCDLITQANVSKVPTLQELPEDFAESYDVILDAIFGFSFQASGEIREPFGSIMTKLGQATLPVVSVDIPSGWHVEEGYQGRGFESPACLISLTAPKLSAALFCGRAHYLGLRMVPDELLDKYGCRPPVQYPSSAQFVRLP